MKNLFKIIISYIIQTEAKLVLKKYKPKVVAITGSVGKTSTKDAIYSVMAGTFHVRKSEKSFNGDIGVPLSILGLSNAWNNPLKWLENIWLGLKLIVSKQTYPNWLVLEVGADRPNDIKKITKWLKPDISVITRFAKVPVHIEFFKSRDDVIKEKGYLAEALKPDGTLVLNSDDEDVLAFKHKVKNKVLTYGLLDEAQIRATNYSISYNEINGAPVGITFKVESGGNCLPVKIDGILGESNIYSSLAAIAVGTILDQNLVESIAQLNKHIAPRGRMNILSGVNQSTIIDDTYNSSPVAVSSALETLGEINSVGRKIAVLGDMMELGRHTAASHREIGVEVAKVCDLLITVGLRSQALAESAIEAGFKEKKILQFDDSVSAANSLKDLIKSNDVILVKGSQSTRMEKVVKEIMAEPEKAGELLVRQDEEWLLR